MLRLPPSNLVNWLMLAMLNSLIAASCFMLQPQSVETSSIEMELKPTFYYKKRKHTILLVD